MLKLMGINILNSEQRQRDQQRERRFRAVSRGAERIQS